MSFQSYLQALKIKLQSRLSAINTSLTAKGVTPVTDLSEVPEAIDSISGGSPLPVLTNPATTNDVMTGKEYIDGNGEKQMGTKIDALKYATNHQNAHTNSLFYNSVFPENSIVELDFSNIEALNDMFRGAVNAKEIIIHNLKASLAGALFNTCRETEIIDLDWSKIQFFGKDSIFAGCSALKEIRAYFDMSQKTATVGQYNFQNSPLLEEIRFVENTLSVSYGQIRYGDNLNGCPNLSSTTLTSLANCLKEGVAKTLALHATCKAKCLTIYGTYADKTRAKSSNTELFATVDTGTYKNAVVGIYGDYVYTYNGTDWVDSSSSVIDLLSYGITLDGTPTTNDTLTVELYHYFTADENGDTSLTEFVTSVKGWTLA